MKTRAVLAAAVFLCLLASCSEKVVPDVVPFDSEKALVDLTNWSFEEDGPARFFGNTWEFYWRRLYTPEDFCAGVDVETPVLVAGGDPWNGVVNGEELTRDGFATYRTLVLLPEPEKLYSFYMKNQDSAYRLWINGELLAENGVVAETEDKYVPQRLPRHFHYHANNRKLEVVIQIANFTHKWGGLTNSIYMGPPEQIGPFVGGRNGTIMFLSGAILIMAFYHLFLFVNRRLDRSSLYFSLFCISVFIWYIITGDYVFFRLFPSFPLGIGIRLYYVSLFGALPFFLLFIYSVYPRSLRRIIVLAPGGAAACLMALVLFSPVPFFSAHTLTPYYILVVIGAVIAAVVLIRALARGQDGAVLSLIGFAGFILTAFYDIAANRKIIVGSPLGPFLPAGLFVFILFQSFILANRISRAYERLDDFANNLEGMVARRTAELENARKKLFEQEKLAALGTLAGGIYHEVFNPLSGISGPLQVIKKEMIADEESPGSGDNETVRRHIENMEANVKNITTVVSNLNNLIHDKLVIKESVELFPLVREVTESVSGRSKKEVDFSIEVGPEDTVLGDKTIIRQIFENLLSNAAAAVESGGMVTVRFESADTGSRILVEDNGRGMSPAEAARAGDPFFTTKETAGGSGLGLFLVKRFAASLGWEISVDSRQGEGTRVVLSLPFSG